MLKKSRSLNDDFTNLCMYRLESRTWFSMGRLMMCRTYLQCHIMQQSLLRQTNVCPRQAWQDKAGEGEDGHCDARFPVSATAVGASTGEKSTCHLYIYNHQSDAASLCISHSL